MNRAYIAYNAQRAWQAPSEHWERFRREEIILEDTSESDIVEASEARVAEHIDLLSSSSDDPPIDVTPEPVSVQQQQQQPAVSVQQQQQPVTTALAEQADVSMQQQQPASTLELPDIDVTPAVVGPSGIDMNMATLGAALPAEGKGARDTCSEEEEEEEEEEKEEEETPLTKQAVMESVAGFDFIDFGKFICRARNERAAAAAGAAAEEEKISMEPRQSGSGRSAQIAARAMSLGLQRNKNGSTRSSRGRKISMGFNFYSTIPLGCASDMEEYGKMCRIVEKSGEPVYVWIIGKADELVFVRRLDITASNKKRLLRWKTDEKWVSGDDLEIVCERRGSYGEQYWTWRAHHEMWRNSAN